LWLEVAAIISSKYPSFGSGLTNITKHWFLLFIFIKSQAAVTGGILMPHMHKALSLCYIATQVPTSNATFRPLKNGINHRT